MYILYIILLSLVNGDDGDSLFCTLLITKTEYHNSYKNVKCCSVRINSLVHMILITNK